ncbi:MAG: hypothetical protein AAB875_04945 [Patescibacteria group bacterium]
MKTSQTESTKEKINLRDEHWNVIISVHLLGGMIKEKDLIAPKDENTIELLIKECYIGRETNKHGTWLFTRTNPVVSAYENLKKQIEQFNPTL